MVFLDTSVLLAGMVDFGPQSAPAQSIFHAVAERKIESPATAGIVASSSTPSRPACLPSSD